MHSARDARVIAANVSTVKVWSGSVRGPVARVRFAAAGDVKALWVSRPARRLAHLGHHLESKGEQAFVPATLPEPPIRKNKE
jgi:hypothetical protein